jgi:hypothetical protein
MTTWIIKSETDDADRALANVVDQRSKGYTAWIEDEHGKAVDEELLKMNKAVPTLRSREVERIISCLCSGCGFSWYPLRGWFVG